GLLGRKSRLLHRLARRAHPLLGREALLIEPAQRALRLGQQLACLAEVGLDRQALLERLPEPPLRLDDGLVARGQLLFELAAPPGELLALLARGELGALRAGARLGECGAARVPLDVQGLLVAVELAARGPRAVE